MQEVKELVQRLGLESSVIFPGYRADANRILREASVAVQASLNENLGGIIEALLMGCPTVATRVGGMVDAVIDGETGVLVCPGDPEDLARGIKQMLRDPERARAMGRAGRELMLGRFTLQRTASDLAELYNHLISKTRKHRKGYDPVVSVARLCLAVPLFVYLVFRFIIVNFYLNLQPISSWDQKARSSNCART
jgi:glycosyltransferase involved in cell wall biosynthesis